MLQTIAITRLATRVTATRHSVSAASALIAMTRRTPRPASTLLRDHHLSTRRRRIVCRDTTGPPKLNAPGMIIHAIHTGLGVLGVMAIHAARALYVLTVGVLGFWGSRGK